jgi:hypothetical protein
MIFTRSISLVTVSLSCLVAMPATGALGATKVPARPTVSSVAPMKAGVGDQLTIKGRNFLYGTKRNTVFFKAGTKPAVAVKAERATRTTIKVIVPKTLEKYIVVKGGVAQLTKFRLRILSKRFAKDYTALRLSPSITLGSASGAIGTISGPAADCDADGIVNEVDTDDDNDLLSDALEVGLKLNQCVADSDSDGMGDGWEYQSALDLNSTVGQALPYAGKRPYPNPLDGQDGMRDWDGDGLTSQQEHLLWRVYGQASLALNYSGGLQRSVAGPTNDDYRDADADGLANFDEFNGPLSGPEWWSKRYSGEVAYPEPYGGMDAVDPDTDGDGVLDGADDTDHDLWTNAQEAYRVNYKVQPFNPCLPDYNSPTCSQHPPFDNPYPPFNVTPLPPAPIAWP